MSVAWPHSVVDVTTTLLQNTKRVSLCNRF